MAKQKIIDNENDVEIAVNVSSLLSKPWQKFFAKFQEIETLKNSQWKSVHLLAYFAKRYEQMYGSKFSFSLNGAPSKCTEIYMINKMLAMLNTTNMRTAREYIDWIFDNKLALSKVKIRTLGYLTTAAFGNEFNHYRVEKAKIVKTTELPTEYKEIAATLELDISTYGDLAFIKMALDQSPESESRRPYRAFFNQLLALGFEPTVLNNLN